MHRGDDERSHQFRAALQHHAGDRAVADHDVLDGRLRADLHAERAGGAGHGGGEPAHAALGEPPRPQLAVAPSATLWCAITKAVPGERGPAHVPITPETDKTPCISGDSKYSSTRSAIDIVKSLV